MSTEEYAVCRDCGQAMSPGTACTRHTLTIDGKEYQRIPYANPHHPDPHYCHDCNTPLGQLHHLGCDMERCPKCGGQLIACGCWEDEDTRS